MATPATEVGVTQRIRKEEAVMVATIAIVLGITVIVLVVVPWFLKAVADTEQGIEDHLLDPGTSKVTYLVPDGVDAAVVSTALAADGFANALDLVGGEERLLIECHPGQREHVRSVITHATRTAYAGSGLTLGAVTFRDET